MKTGRLHIRIAFSFVLLLLVALVASLALVNFILSASAQSEVEQSLVAGERVFGLLIEDNRRQLLQSASILSADFAFRKAVATADRGTVLSALGNHGARINADIAMLVDADGKLFADTHLPNASGQAFAFPTLILAAEQHRQAAATVVMEHRLYQLVVVPVLAPLPVAWLVLGFLIDDRLARSLRSLTLLEISFAAKESASDQWRMLTSTMVPASEADMPSALAGIDFDRSGKLTLNAGGDEYLAHVVTMDAQPPQAVVAVLQRSLRQALEPLHHLQQILLALGGVSLFAGVIASLLLARGITKPIASLAMLAGRIEQGDYSEAAPIERDDEVGRLANAFNHMRDGISAREARISELAFRDQLTGLPNRALFNDRLEQAIRAAKREGEGFSVLLLDLDRFKEVNDILGHQVGDLLLQEIGRRLETTLMREADAVARLGGDEFAVLLPATDARGAQVIARRLLDSLEQPIELEQQKVTPGGSIGVASYPEHGEEASTLLRHADLAMYVAKENRSGFAVFDPTIDQYGQERLSLMAELRHAVEHNELVLFYQPKVDLTNGTLSNVEALARWQHPERGMVPPGEFIPFAEKTGYIREITCWAIEAALKQRLKWQKDDLPLTISVNVSARDLMKTDFPDMIAGLLGRYGASPDWLTLEITESAIMADPQRALNVLERLHGMGLRLSVDDFGIGYSSLAYLKKLPVSELKIDMSFIRNMDNDKDDETIVRSTVDLGHNMGLKVVAEGVETEAIWNMLREMGCDVAQGYYLSRPLAADALVQWIRGSAWRVTAEG